jgi:hypothetical protein
VTELRVAIRGLSMLGPGLAGWAASAPILAGETPWQQADYVPPAPTLLPATERRRTSPSVRLALAAAVEAVQASGIPPEELASVFASSNGDGTVIGAILDALQEPLVQISPTQFHNSVHNAAAGYWGIAAGATRPSVSLGGHDRVFATGLLHAATQAVATREPVLFCAYDVPLPAPLSGRRPTDVPFATAMVLSPAQGDPALALRFVAEPCASEPALAGALGALVAQNPVARALPLLAALAARRPAAFAWSLTEDSRLEVSVA